MVIVAVVLGAAIAIRTPRGNETARQTWTQFPRDAQRPCEDGCDDVMLSAALNNLAREVQAGAKSEDFRSLARIHLDRYEYDAAVRAMQRASLAFPADPATFAALSAAHLERYAAARNWEDLLAGTSAAQRALRMSASSQAAAFNYGLALQSLHLRDAAIKAWSDYLTLDPDSPWAARARGALRSLQRPLQDSRWNERRPQLIAASARSDRAVVEAIVHQFPQESRILAERELLSHWSGADQSNLKSAAMIADALASHGDMLLRHSIDAIDAADAAQKALLREAHAKYADARASYENTNPNAALALASDAAVGFSKARSPFELRARLLIASCVFYKNDPVGALAALDLLDSAIGAKAELYRVLYGQTQWLRGLLLVVQGKPGKAVRHYELGLAVLEKTGETENIAAVHGLLAEAYEYLGDGDRAFTHRVAAMRLITPLGKPPRIQAVYSEAADAFVADFPDVALLYQDAIVRYAREWKVPVQLSDALVWRSLILHRLKRRDEALSDIAEAREVAARIEDGDTKARNEADIDSVEGRIRATIEPRVAIPLLSRALRFFHAEGNLFFHAARLLLERGRCRKVLGDSAAAEDDFHEGLKLLESHREALDDDRLRVAFFERSDALFDEAITLAIGRGDSIAATDLVERSRARSLLDAYAEIGATAAVSNPMTVDEICAALPEDTAIVHYALLPSRTMISILRSSGPAAILVPIGEQAVNQIVADVAVAVERNAAEPFVQSMSLAHDRLLDPVRQQLAGVRHLVLIPVGRLYELPFAAMRDRSTQRFLIEDYAVSVAPSASFFIKSTARATQLARRPGSTAIFANPAFDSNRHPTLPKLPAAAREGRRVAEMWGGILRAGDDATVSAFRESFASSTILHYAGHATWNERHPDYSALILAAGEGDEGVLYARELASLPHANVRLVILAACETARGKTWRIEGTSSIARSFLAAGVPTVLATLWPVDDEAASAVLRRVHQGLREGEDAAAAIRAAQVSLLQQPHAAQSPLQWFAFQTIGGGFAFTEGGKQ